jgi:very-short-patch-repair endonuclease
LCSWKLSLNIPTYKAYNLECYLYLPITPIVRIYGSNQEGKFNQRFGAINHQKGYKLLNVIITRAKYKIYVCSSIPEKVFLNYNELLVTEGSNNRRAVFYAYLAYCKAVSENDNEKRLSILNNLALNAIKKKALDNLDGELESPFEEEVYYALIEHIDESKLIPQLSIGGFRIDMVYDSKIPGIPKIAIECDGAEYHSSKEAYLEDIHRQKILEQYGFIFHRIWSTNWWRNSKKETKRLVNFIKEIESSEPSSFNDLSKTGEAFTHDVEITVKKGPSYNSEEIEEVIKTITKKPKKQVELFEAFVEIGSNVKVKYLNNGKDLKVQIVNKEIKTNSNKDGIQKISNKSALAVALMGKSVGETTRVGNLDNYVEVLEII